MLEAAEKEINRVSPMVEDFERDNSELRSAYFSNDDELIFIHAEVSRLKEIASKLESKEVDLQGALSASVNLKKKLDELQGAHTGLVEENTQLKNEKFGHEVAAFGGPAEGQVVHARVAEDELMEALATECVVVDKPAIVQAAKK
ncbi:hypothetical protein ACFX1X_027466 [Malus domestica]